MSKAVIGIAECKYRKTNEVAVIEIEVMAPAGGEAALFRELVQFCHGEKVMVTLAPEELKDEQGLVSGEAF